jgi:hypothetical protein
MRFSSEHEEEEEVDANVWVNVENCVTEEIFRRHFSPFIAGPVEKGFVNFA